MLIYSLACWLFVWQIAMARRLARAWPTGTPAAATAKFFVSTHSHSPLSVAVARNSLAVSGAVEFPNWNYPTLASAPMYWPFYSMGGWICDGPVYSKCAVPNRAQLSQRSSEQAIRTRLPRFIIVLLLVETYLLRFCLRCMRKCRRFALAWRCISARLSLCSPASQRCLLIVRG